METIGFKKKVSGAGLTSTQVETLAKVEPNKTSIAKIIKNNSSDTQPTVIYPYMWWADTTTEILKIRNKDNDAWVSVLTLATGVPISGGTGGGSGLTQDQIDELAKVVDKADRTSVDVIVPAIQAADAIIGHELLPTYCAVNAGLNNLSTSGQCNGIAGNDFVWRSAYGNIIAHCAYLDASKTTKDTCEASGKIWIPKYNNIDAHCVRGQSNITSCDSSTKLILETPAVIAVPAVVAVPQTTHPIGESGTDGKIVGYSNGLAIEIDMPTGTGLTPTQIETLVKVEPNKVRSEANELAIQGKAPTVHSHGTSTILDKAINENKLSDLLKTKVNAVNPQIELNKTKSENNTTAITNKANAAHSHGTAEILDKAITFAKMADGSSSSSGKVMGFNANKRPVEVDVPAAIVVSTKKIERDLIVYNNTAETIKQDNPKVVLEGIVNVLIPCRLNISGLITGNFPEVTGIAVYVDNTTTADTIRTPINGDSTSSCHTDVAFVSRIPSGSDVQNLHIRPYQLITDELPVGSYRIKIGVISRWDNNNFDFTINSNSFSTPIKGSSNLIVEAVDNSNISVIGGTGASSNFSETILYEKGTGIGTGLITLNNQSDYDAYMFISGNTKSFNIYTKAVLKDTVAYPQLLNVIYFDTDTNQFNWINARTFDGEKLNTFEITSEPLQRVYGIKFGSGGGTGSGTTLTPEQLAAIAKVSVNETAIAANAATIVTNKTATDLVIAETDYKALNLYTPITEPAYCNSNGNHTTEATCLAQLLTSWIPKQNGIDAHCVYHNGHDKAACIADPLYDWHEKNGIVPEHCSYHSQHDDETKCKSPAAIADGFIWMLEQIIYKPINELQVGVNSAAIGEMRIAIQKTDVFIRTFETDNLMIEASAGDFTHYSDKWTKNHDNIKLVKYLDYDVYKVAGPTSQNGHIRQLLVLEQMQNLHDKGGIFAIEMILPPTTTQGCFIAFELNIGTQIMNGTTSVFTQAKQRLGLFSAVSGTNIKIAGSQADFTDVLLDGSNITAIDWEGVSVTHATPNIKPDELFKLEVHIRDGLDQRAFLYANDILVANPRFIQSSNANGTWLNAEQGSSNNNAQRVFYLSKFGATINKVLPTLSISKDDLEKNLRAFLILPKGTRNYEIILDRNINLNVGYTIDFMSQNNGKISWKPLDTTTGLNVIMNGKSTGFIKTLNLQNRTFTNVLKDGSQFILN